MTFSIYHRTSVTSTYRRTSVTFPVYSRTSVTFSIDGCVAFSIYSGTSVSLCLHWDKYGLAFTVGLMWPCIYTGTSVASYSQSDNCGLLFTVGHVWPSIYSGTRVAFYFTSSLHLSLSLVDRWGTKDDWATPVLHSSLLSAFRRASPNFKPVHPITLSSNLFFCLPFLLPPCTVPCRIIFASPVDLVMCQYHLSLRFFTVVRISS